MLASGTPLNRSDMSATALLIMALVSVALLAVWLLLVFLAARVPRRRGPQPGEDARAEPATLTGAAAQAEPGQLGDRGMQPEPGGQAAGDGHATEPVPASAGYGR